MNNFSDALSATEFFVVGLTKDHKAHGHSCEQKSDPLIPQLQNYPDRNLYLDREILSHVNTRSGLWSG